VAVTWARRMWSTAGLIVILVTGIAVHDQTDTTYAGSDPRLLWSQVAVALALLAAGALTVQPGRSLALTALGALWLLPELEGWRTGPATLRTLAAGAACLLPALVIAAVTPRPPSRLPRAQTIAAGFVLVGTTIAVGSRLFLIDPFFDLRCWRSCGHNPLALPVGGTTGRVLEVVGLALVVGAAGVLAAGPEAVDATLARHRTVIRISVVALLAGLVSPFVLRLGIRESATAPVFLACLVLALVGGLALAVVASLPRLRGFVLAVQLNRLAGNIRTAPAPGQLAAALGRAVRDPDLQIRYWVKERGEYVDAEGRPVVLPVADESRRLTAVTRSGALVATIVHASRVDGAQLDRALGAALRLVLENEQLRAGALAELAELELSRARIVERAASERRQLERNLHDGAQQRVVTLSLLVRMLAKDAPNEATAKLADHATVLVRTILEELRRVARGIHPAVLADAGLAGALHDLADSSTDVSVTVDSPTLNRYDGVVESTAYLVVVAALADARDRSARRLAVSAVEKDGLLVLRLDDDSFPGPAHATADLADQVAALSGRLCVDSGKDGAHVVMELPCVS
jgi:signal transduction histidine kinase